jgi:hypothetical protein
MRKEAEDLPEGLIFNNRKKSMWQHCPFPDVGASGAVILPG